LQAEHVLKALADIDAGALHNFGKPKTWELVYEGKRYAPKAVLGLAFRYVSGRPLQPRDFRSGESETNHRLRKLGFTVVKKGQLVEGEEPARTGQDWTPTEVALVVTDYFAMLRAELLQLPYSKTKHRNALRPRLLGRSDSSIEFKHANISAVLVRMGLPYIAGYQPRGNYQALLAQAVESFLDANPTFLEELASGPVVNPKKAPAVSFADPESIFEPPPGDIILPEPTKPWLSRRSRRTNFAERDAANRRLGEMGEKFVVNLERARLREKGRDDLAQKVDWVTDTVGDGLGYDILSFNADDDSEMFLEVKTTGLSKEFPFYVTATEVCCSEDKADQYHLYRVFDFWSKARVYVLRGSLRERCHLQPTLFLAAP
jgi:hypothetical protein